MQFLSLLPQELIVQILSLIDNESLFSVAQTSRKYQILIKKYFRIPILTLLYWKNWQVSARDLIYEKKVGVTTYKGLCKDKVVALKRLPTDISIEENWKPNVYEIRNPSSPNILKIIAISIDFRPMIVLEYCSRGSLYDIISTEKIDWQTFFKISIGIARALETLHTHKPQVILGDFATKTILITQDWIPKVQHIPKIENQEVFRGIGDYSFLSPHLLTKKVPDSEANMYAFGMILWEISNVIVSGLFSPFGSLIETGKHKRPYQDIPQIKLSFQTIIFAKKGVRPAFDPNLPDVLKQLIESLWQNDPQARPSSSETLKKLIQMETEYLNKWIH